MPQDSILECDETTTVRIIDDGAGEFLEISQYIIPEPGKIGKIQINDLEEWEAIKSAIETLGFKKKNKTKHNKK